MFFDGAHDSKKKVSLGGKNRSKTQESKQDFLERTKREREERELVRRRERAVLCIQGFIRGKKILTNIREQERSGWDASLEAVVQEWHKCSDATGRPAVLDSVTKNFVTLLRRFLFFYREWNPEDGHRLTVLTKWLVLGKFTALSGPPGLAVLVEMASNDSQKHVALKRLLLLCKRSFDRLYRAFDAPKLKILKLQAQGDVPMLQMDEKLEEFRFDAALLLRLCDAASWTCSDGQSRRSRLLNFLVDLGLMKMVRKHLDLDDGKSPINEVGQTLSLQQQLQIVLCGLVVHALNAGYPVAFENFCSHLLTKPLLFQGLHKNARQILEFKNLWDLLLLTLATNDCALLRKICDIEGSIGSTGILGNLVDMSAASLSAASPQATGRFAACACLLLRQVRLANQISRDNQDIMDDDDGDNVVHRSEIEVETSAGRVRMQHVRVSRVEGDGPFNSRKRILPASLASVREYIAAICNRDYIFKLIDVVQRVAPPAAENLGTGMRNVTDEDQAIIAATSGLLLQLTDFLPESRADVLNALAFKPAVLSMLWDWIRNVRAQAQSSKRSGGIPLEGPVDPALVSLFCLTYNHLLLTSDHSEFYERQFPFSLTQVREMVSVIKSSIVPLYWTASVLTEPQQLLRAAGSVLLSSLLERNCYREFAPAEEWHAEGRFVSTLVAELDGSQAARLADPDRDESEGGRKVSLEARHQTVLERVPFVLPFALRVRILRHLVSMDRQGHLLLDSPVHWLRCTIRRSRVVEDSYLELNKHGSNLKQTIQVSFVNQEGLQEAGIDGGGLFKEFMNTLSSQAFNPQYGLFCLTAEGLLFPNPQAETAHPWQGSIEHLRLFEFLGRMVGKAIYEGILVELRLAPFFLRRMLGQALHFDDLRSLDPELHRNLLFVRSYEGDFEDLALNFVVVEDRFGETQTVELVPGGANIPVTRENVLRYRHLVSDYWLNRRIRAQSEAFMRGLRDLIRPEWIRAFSPLELQTLLAGAAQPIDLADLRAHCTYGGGYTDEHPSVQLFWEVAGGLSDAERQALLLFVTSCSRPPLLGFRDLHPPFCIQKTSHPPEEADSRLPTASTCMNLLKLPSYSNAADLKAS